MKALSHATDIIILRTYIPIVQVLKHSLLLCGRPGAFESRNEIIRLFGGHSLLFFVCQKSFIESSYLLKNGLWFT